MFFSRKIKIAGISGQSQNSKFSFFLAQEVLFLNWGEKDFLQKAASVFQTFSLDFFSRDIQQSHDAGAVFS